jgi:hypothetical protein
MIDRFDALALEDGRHPVQRGNGDLKSGEMGNLFGDVTVKRPKASRRQHFQAPATGVDRPAERRRARDRRIREGLQKTMMTSRIRGDESNSTQPLSAIVMALKQWIPEILWKVLLTDEKGCCIDQGRLREGERKRDLDRSLVRPFRLAAEVKRFAGADLGGVEKGTVATGVVRAQNQHGEAVALFQITLKEAGKGAGIAVRRAVFGFAEPDQFEKSALELNDMVFGTPWMLIARPDLEAQTTEQSGMLIEIMASQNEVIERATHGE